MCAGEVSVRPACPGDRHATLALCRRALGWKDDDPNEAFYRWKHDDNVFGSSATTVAVAEDGTIVGLRAFMRWEFRENGGRVMRVVRAVDTATDPDWQGRGIFTKLTLSALPGLVDEGVAAVFNTPNDKSRPGYLKMGWSTVGTVPVGARFSSANGVRRAVTARTAAELWSEPVDCGLDASIAFADANTTTNLIERARAASGLATPRSAEVLHWRYRFEPLRYRVFPLGNSMSDGVIVFRVRLRGGAREATICDIIAPPRARPSAALRQIAKESGADYLLAAGGRLTARAGFVPMPGLGPTLTWRPLARPGVPTLGDLDLTIGDIELF